MFLNLFFPFNQESSLIHPLKKWQESPVWMMSQSGRHRKSLQPGEPSRVTGTTQGTRSHQTWQWENHLEMELFIGKSSRNAGSSGKIIYEWGFSITTLITWGQCGAIFEALCAIGVVFRCPFPHPVPVNYKKRWDWTNANITLLCIVIYYPREIRVPGSLGLSKETSQGFIQGL